MTATKNTNNNGLIALGVLAAGGLLLLGTQQNGWSNILGEGGGTVGGDNQDPNSGGSVLPGTGEDITGDSTQLPAGSLVSQLLTFVNNTPQQLVGGYNPDSVFTSGNYLSSLHGDAIPSNKFEGTLLGFFNPNTLNQGYGQRTDITALATGINGVPVDYSGVGLATYWTKKDGAVVQAEVRDQRLYNSNFAAAMSQQVYNNPGKSTESMATDAANAASVATKKSETLQAAPRVYTVYYNDGGGVKTGYSYDPYGSQASLMTEDPRTKKEASVSSGKADSDSTTDSQGSSSSSASSSSGSSSSSSGWGWSDDGSSYSPAGGSHGLGNH
jgi:hypothetical protein